MAPAREENGYEGGGGFGKFRKRPFRKTQTTPYDRPPTALRNPTQNNSWFSKIVDPASRLINYSAHRLFSSVFRKRLPPPPSETVQEVRDSHHEVATSVANESSGKVEQGVTGEPSDQINCSDGRGLTELEKLFKQKSFTRSEIDRLTELMHSRTVDSRVREKGKGIEEVPPVSMLPRDQNDEYPKTPVLENGIENHLVSTPRATSSVSIQDVASPAELAKAYMGNRPSKVSPLALCVRSPPTKDPALLKGHDFGQKSPIMSIGPRTANLARVHENGFVTPRSRGRSAIYNMAQTPYARAYPASTLKVAGLSIGGKPSSSSQHALDLDIPSGSKQGALKRRSSVLDNDIGSFGPIRRIRQKSNLLSSKGLTSHNSGLPLSIARSGVGIDAAWQPSSSMRKSIRLGEVKHSHKKMSAENVEETMPSTSFPPVHSQSSELGSKILQQLDKMTSPKGKSSELRLPNVHDKSPTKLSSSMLRGQALRSLDTVDSSKLLDNVQYNELDGTPGNSSAFAKRMKSKTGMVENGPTKLVSYSDGLIPVVTDADTTVPRKQVTFSVNSGDSSLTEPVSYPPPPKKRAFHMSAHEDYLELDDDTYPNGAASPVPTPRKETTESAAVAERSASAIVKPVQEMTPGSSVVMSSICFTTDGKPHVSAADGSIVDKKAEVPTSITSSIAADYTVKPTMGAVEASPQAMIGFFRSTSSNGSIANPFGNKVVPSTAQTGADDPSEESSKPGQMFGLNKAAPSKEPGADASSVNFGVGNFSDNVSQVPITFSSSAGGETTGFKFGGASDSKLKSSISSTTAAGAVNSVPKVVESDNASAKSNIVSGFSAPASELAFSSAASTSSLASPTNMFTFGNSSNKMNGSTISSPPLSSTFPPMVTNNLTSQNSFGGSSLATSSSSISATAAFSNCSSSAPVTVSSSPTTSFFKFGSAPISSTSLPVSSSGSEPVETRSGQDTGVGNIGSTSFGVSSAPVGSTGSGIFGISSPAITSVSSQSQGSVFGTTSASTPGTLAQSAANGFANSNPSQSVAFGSSASSPFGLTGNTPFSSGSSSFPSSSLATNIFNSGTTSGQSIAATSMEAKPVSSNNGTSSNSFGLSSWQPSKSPFGTSFVSSSASTSGFSFTSSNPVASTSSPAVFGSSTSAPGPQFSFTSASATPNMQPTFGSPAPAFAFGSASPSDQMGMEDSMAEDTVQATAPPATPIFGQQPAPVQSTPVFGQQPAPVQSTPVFGQQPAPVQSNFVFGAPTPTPTAGNPFQFGGQQNVAPQSPSPFQATGSLEFNAGGSFSLGTGGGDKAGRKYVKVKHKQRKK